MSARPPSEWILAERILMRLLRLARPMHRSDAYRFCGGFDPATTLRMLVAEGILLRFDGAAPGSRESSWSFTREGRSIAESTELRLFAAGQLDNVLNPTQRALARPSPQCRSSSRVARPTRSTTRRDLPVLQEHASC